jgi:hypothetical protein
MKFASQRQLPLSFQSSVRSAYGPAKAPGRVLDGQVANGQAVVRLVTHGVRRSGAVQAAAPVVSLPQRGPVVAPGADGEAGRPTAGARFARARLRHAVEVFGSCMMIGAFLVLALFG